MSGAKLTFGRYPEVSLKDARVKCFEARKLVAKGIDPSEERRNAKQATPQAKVKSQSLHSLRRDIPLPRGV